MNEQKPHICDTPSAKWLTMNENTQSAGVWHKYLLRTGNFWFAVTAVGQLAFIAFIISFYATRTFTGNSAAWNDRDIITGYVTGDALGNIMFAAHVLLAAVVTLGGLLQLLPALRASYPAVHRWNGRVFLGLACFLAVGGLWMTWVRGSHLSIVSGLSVSLNGLLILVFAALTIHFARRRRFDAHQNWALRTFMVVSGVWFFRVGLMGWILLNQSPRWMNSTLSGPADIGLSLGSYLVPLFCLEVYLAAKRSPSKWLKIAAAALIIIMTLLMAVGIFGAVFMMWF